VSDFEKFENLMLPDAIEEPDVIGLLARHIPARVIDISRTGCLLESQQRVDIGAVGELRLEIQRQTLVDEVRVIRCVLLEGSSSTYLVGAEFVPTRRPGERSIRRSVASILRGLPGGSGPLERSRKPAVVNSVRFKGEVS